LTTPIGRVRTTRRLMPALWQMSTTFATSLYAWDASSMVVARLNPISQFIVKTTNWALKPLRRIIPGLGGIDLASIVLMLGVQMLVLFLIAMARGFSVHFSGLTVLSIAELMALLLNVYMMTIIAQAILSWVGPGSHNPLSSLLYSLNEPVLRPFRRLIPAISGIDLAPLAALIVIQFTKILIVGPITSIGNSLS